MDKLLWKIGLPVLALFLLALGLTTIKQIDSGYVGVKSNLGVINKTELAPGIHVKLPFLQGIQIMDVKVQSIEYKGNKEGGNRNGIWTKPSINVLDTRSLPINIEMAAQFQLQESSAAEVLEKYGVNYPEKLINNIFREEVRNVFGSYTGEQIAMNRGELMKKLRTSIQKRFEIYPITISDVQLRDVKLPKSIVSKMEEVQKTNQEKEKAEILLEQAKIEAETVKVKANAQAQAQIEVAKGQAESIKITSEAEANANKLIRESINEEIVKYKSIEAWQQGGSQVPKVMSGNGGNILQLPSNIIGDNK